jgi:hypothetical protein
MRFTFVIFLVSFSRTVEESGIGIGAEGAEIRDQGMDPEF